MNKPMGYDDAQAIEGGTQQLPAGNYACVIKKAIERKSSTGKNMLVLLLDITEGKYKDYFNRRFEASKGYNSDAKWGCVYRQLTEGRSIPYFKGMIKAIEESNPGYTWNFDERTLAGKRVGALFGREEYLSTGGEVRMSCKPRFLCSVGSLKEKGVLPDKKLETGSSFVGGGFVDMGEVGEDDLPF